MNLGGMPGDYGDVVRRWREQNRFAAPERVIRNLQAGEAEVFIYDVIGEDWWTGGGVTARDLVPELRSLQANKILVRVNSPGGSITEAVAIRNALIDHPAEIEMHVDGAAYSAASWVGMVPGGAVIMHRQSSMFLHDGWTFAWGNEDALRREADFVGGLSDQIAEMYAEKAGGTVAEWRQVMKDELFLKAEDAVERGLADEVAGEATTENRRVEPTKRNAEKALRDAGFSIAEAKALLGDDPRDVGREPGGVDPRDVGDDASDRLYAALLAAPKR